MIDLFAPDADTSALCRLLDIDADELAWFADLQQRGRRAPARLQHYLWRVLPKRGGVRVLAAPKTRLKEIQRRLLRSVVERIPLHEAAHGCVRGRSVRTALAPHAGTHVLMRLDLETFFPTVTAARVRGLLTTLGMDDALSRHVAALCSTSVPASFWTSVPRSVDLDSHERLRGLLRERHLAQGAPTSPALANAVAYRLDRRLAGLARRYDATYTRYVDDLIFSGGRATMRHRGRLLDLVAAFALEEGFRVAHRKTAVLTAAGRLEALGATVNHHPTLPRPDRDRLRAIVHNCAMLGPAGQGVTRDQLLGHIAAAQALDPVLGRKLRRRFDEIAWS